MTRSFWPSCLYLLQAETTGILLCAQFMLDPLLMQSKHLNGSLSPAHALSFKDSFICAGEKVHRLKHLPQNGEDLSLYP